MSGEQRRVLFLTGEYPPMAGGLADHTRRLQGALEAIGWSTAVLTATAASPGTRVSAIVDRWDWSTFERLGRAIRAHQPDVVHLQYQTAAYGMHPAVCLVPHRLAAAGGPPVVVQMHDLRVPYLLPKAIPLRRMVTRALMRWAGGLILPTRSDFDRVEAWLGKAAGLLPAGRPRARLIPIGANVEEDPPAGYDWAAFRAGLGIPPGATLIAFFGLANWSKGLETLLESLAAARRAGHEVRLLIVGGSTGATDPTNQTARADLLRAIGDLDLGPAVTLTGTVAPRDVSAHLIAADLAALPFRDGASFRRGSLLAILAHGLPLITTRGRDAGLRQVDGAALEDGINCRLVPPDDAPALTAAILDLAADPAARSRLAAGARDLAEAFRWPGIARSTADLYEDVMYNRGVRSG